MYQPWVTSGGRVNAQKLLQIKGPTSGVFTRFACTWPGGSDDKWLLSQAEAHARNVNVPENAEAFLRKEACSLHDLLENQKIPDGFQTFQFDHSLVWQFKLTHKVRISLDESCWAHILDGFQGNVLEVDADGQVPNVFNDWSVLISRMGNMIAGTHALGDRMLANKKK